jgi:hypothetical protein
MRTFEEEAFALLSSPATEGAAAMEIQLQIPALDEKFPSPPIGSRG